MLVIGLTGGIGCGKSEAARMFAALGVPVVDVDVIARQLTSPGKEVLKEIASVFGPEYIAADGSLDRAKMRDKVFNDVGARKELEGIMHPAIYDQALKEIEQNRSAPYQILAISLLFENNRYKNVVSRSLVIDCAESQQIERTMKRSGVSEETVRNIMAAQVSRATRLKRADNVIENSGTLDELREKVAAMHKNYLKACSASE